MGFDSKKHFGMDDLDIRNIFGNFYNDGFAISSSDEGKFISIDKNIKSSDINIKNHYSKSSKKVSSFKDFKIEFNPVIKVKLHGDRDMDLVRYMDTLPSKVEQLNNRLEEFDCYIYDYNANVVDYSIYFLIYKK